MNARRAPGPKAPVSGLLSAQVHFEGRQYLLALVRTFWLNEGVAIFEALSLDGTDAVAVEVGGTWRIKTSDEGPAVLAIEGFYVPDDLTDHDDQLLNLLLADLLRVGGASWGFEAFERAGDVR